MILRFSGLLTRLFDRYLPSPFIITLLLTLIVFTVALIIQDNSFIQTVDYWQLGFWELMTFTMQMSLILIFGYAFANTVLINNLINRIVKNLNSMPKAVYSISLAAMIVSMLNWGLGLIFGAILARKFAEHAIKNGI